MECTQSRDGTRRNHKRTNLVCVGQFIVARDKFSELQGGAAIVDAEEGVGHGDQIQEIPTVVPLMEKPITTPYFVDTKSDIGIAYRYAVAALDKNGNRSELVWTDWVVIPKTP